MTTKTKNAPKREQKPEPSQHKGGFTPKDLKAAVIKAFQGTKGRIDAKYLWTEGSVHRFRVNCWSEELITSSEFVHVVEKAKKLTVRRAT